MSRIGRLPIAIPPGVKVEIKDSEVKATGPKGELRQSFSPDMAIKLSDNTLTVSRPTDSKQHRSLHGLTRTLLANMLEGVNKGFEKSLDTSGVGYRVQKSGDKIVLSVGFSHPVEVVPLPGTTLQVEGTNRINVVGINKQTVGQMAALIRAIRPIDSYKGKGIKYTGEVVHLKAGKAGKAIGKK